ncbi:actin-related protein 5 [Hydra vulgaris]|uniref:Actin-related protein 5 n=1 Tax=Hydra vulgaris TaxID=6087 RepID=A0ABM4DJ14_HYDVU
MVKKFEFCYHEFQSDPIWKYEEQNNSNACIIIDNGSHSCRAGWSTDEQPKLVYRNLMAKLRTKKESDIISTFYGNDIRDLEDSKWNILTQFDSDVVAHFDTQEFAFDYLFTHLGINTNGAVNHPICISEAICIPNNFRHNMTELLFEGYCVPKIVYGIDCLFSLNYNKPDLQDGLVIRCGYQTSHILPILNSKFDAVACRRLNLGGLNMMIYMNRLLHLKYPNQSTLFNLSGSQNLLIEHAYVASNYAEELKMWQNKQYAESSSVSLQVPVINATNEKELEMRRIQAQRLKDINQKKREEKIKVEREELRKFECIMKLAEESQSHFKSKLVEEGLKNESQLSSVIQSLREKILEREEKSIQYFRELNEGVSFVAKNNESTSIEDVEKLIEELENKSLEIMDRKYSRNLRKQALNKRKSYASKERMRILSQLAKSGKNTNNGSSKIEKEDTFGMKDEDWDVYKFISKDGDDSEDEQDEEKLTEIKQSLGHYQLLLNKLMVSKGQKFQQLPLITELTRVPEILFQPSIVGIEQDGLVSSICYVLQNYDKETQQRMIKNIFLTGGISKLKGFKERLTQDLMAVLPFQSEFNIYEAKDCLKDAWYGAKKFINTSNIGSIAIDRKDYEEKGIGYLKEHKCSNHFYALSV